MARMWRDNQFGPLDIGFRGLPTERTDDPAPFVVNDPRVGGNLVRIRWIEPADGYTANSLTCPLTWRTGAGTRARGRSSRDRPRA